MTLTYAWKENTHYHLILQKDFAEDTLGEKLLKIDTITFKTKKESDYGNLRLPVQKPGPEPASGAHICIRVIRSC